ncbi:hypothetical protein BOX15_Mlig024373g2, partial [Macrostomum lignano]
AKVQTHVANGGIKLASQTAMTAPATSLPASAAADSWGSAAREATVSAAAPDGCLQLSLTGGAENGQLCALADIRPDQCVFWQGRAESGDILLEVQGHRVSGFTLRDARELLAALSANGAPVVLKTLPAGRLSPDLARLLRSQFDAGSPEAALQSVVRDNLYLRTVPVTTRARRENEIDGVDYAFIGADEFDRLERAGRLLESGVFEGNRYGTPRPAPEATGLFRRTADGGVAADSAASASTSKAGSPSRKVNAVQPQPRSETLPTGKAASPEAAAADAASTDESPLPAGWERVVDPKYGVFYIDHFNRRTQYDRPTAASTGASATLDGSATSSASMPHSRSCTNGLALSSGDLRPARHVRMAPSISVSDVASVSALPAARQEPVFTPNPARLCGPFQTVSLVKAATGLGFTIVGGGERGQPEFLQVKGIVAGGPAHRDGRLATGDVLMFVNDTLVLGFTHEDVVELFSCLEPGRAVALTVSKAYRLPRSANDPTAQVITKLAVGPAGYGGSIQDVQSAAIRSTSSASNSVELVKLVLPRTNTGFGFTIADSAQGQRVRLIVEPDRCRGLRTGDILVEINARRVKELPHADVVRILSDCPVGSDATFLLQRGCPTLTSADLASSSASSSSAAAAVATVASAAAAAASNRSAPSPMPPVLTGKGQESGRASATAAVTSSSTSTFGPPGSTATLSKSASSTRHSSSSGGSEFVRRGILRSSRPEASTIVQHQQHVVAFPTSQRPSPPANGNHGNSSNGNSRDVTVARAPDEGFGFVIVSAVTRQPDGTSDIGEFVGEVVQGSPASRCLRKGDRILAVNGTDVARLHHEDIVAIVRESGLAVTLTIGPPAPAAQAGAIAAAAAAAAAASTASGGGSVGRASFSSVASTGDSSTAAAAAGRQSGGGGGGGGSLKILPTAAASSTAGAASSCEEFEVELRRTVKGFGFSIRGGAEFNQMPFYVLRIADGGGAAENGRLRVGDEILAIGGRSLRGLTHTEAVQVIRGAGDALRLRCRRGSGGPANGGAPAAPSESSA